LAAQKKRHHFVPVTYLRGFTDQDGFLNVTRKDKPDEPIRLRPSEAAFRNYYYSQPLSDGSMNHNALEDVFSTFESKWPGAVDVLTSGTAPNRAVEDLVTMVGFQRVRVPAFRDAIEHSLELHARQGLDELNRRGEIPAPPPDLPNAFELLEVTIDPHQSIHGMTKLLRQIGLHIDTLGYQVCRNQTDVDFITSDNPVSYYTITAAGIAPYILTPNAQSELIYPITSRLALIGRTTDRKRFARKGLKFSEIRSAEKIRFINRTTAQFGYEALFSSKRLPAAFVQKYRTSPVLHPASPGFHPDDLRMPDFAFGERKKLLKWKY
jgi:hypothetical protein